MASSIRIRTSYHDGITTVRAIIRHPMDTGFERNPETGEVIPAYFIEEVICSHEGMTVLRCHWSRAVSKNPYLSFMFAGARPGDRLRISWVDTKGITDSAEVVIK